MNIINLPPLPLKTSVNKIDITVRNFKLCRNIDYGYVHNKLFDEKFFTYDENYKMNHSFDQEYFVHLNKMADKLIECTEVGSSLIEIGCGNGYFIQILENREFYKKIIGFDPAYCGDKKNIKKSLFSITDSFDVNIIVMRHVLEHIKHPVEFLKNLSTIIKNEDTIIYIEVPNFEKILSNQMFLEISYEHVNYFKLDDLKNIFGDDVIACGECFNSEYLYVIANLKNIKIKKIFNEEILDFYGLFPKINKFISDVESLIIHERFFIWGAGARSVLFLAHCANLNKLLDKEKVIIDIDENKNNKYLSYSNNKIINPKNFKEIFEKDDLLIISNNKYSIEIQEFLDKEKLLNKINIKILG